MADSLLVPQREMVPDQLEQWRKFTESQPPIGGDRMAELFQEHVNDTQPAFTPSRDAWWNEAAQREQPAAPTQVSAPVQKTLDYLTKLNGQTNQDAQGGPSGGPNVSEGVSDANDGRFASSAMQSATGVDFGGSELSPGGTIDPSQRYTPNLTPAGVQASLAGLGQQGNPAPIVPPTAGQAAEAGARLASDTGNAVQQVLTPPALDTDATNPPSTGAPSSGVASLLGGTQAPDVTAPPPPSLAGDVAGRGITDWLRQRGQAANADYDLLLTPDDRLTEDERRRKQEVSLNLALGVAGGPGPEVESTIGRAAPSAGEALTRRSFYHVAPAEYRPGEPIYSADELERLTGQPVTNKWAEINPSGENPDSDVISLFRTRVEADAFNRDFHDGQGRVLGVDVPADQESALGTNAEGFPIVNRAEVPPEWVTSLSQSLDTHGLQALREVADRDWQSVPDAAGSGLRGLVRDAFTILPDRESEGAYMLVGPGGHEIGGLPSVADAREMATRLEATGADLANPQAMQAATGHVLQQQEQGLAPTRLAQEVSGANRLESGEPGTVVGPTAGGDGGAAARAAAPDVGAAGAAGGRIGEPPYAAPGGRALAPEPLGGAGPNAENLASLPSGISMRPGAAGVLEDLRNQVLGTARDLLPATRAEAVGALGGAAAGAQYDPNGDMTPEGRLRNAAIGAIAGKQLAGRLPYLRQDLADIGRVVRGEYEAPPTGVVAGGGGRASTAAPRPGGQGPGPAFVPSDAFTIRMGPNDRATAGDIRTELDGLRRSQVIRGNQLADQIRRMAPDEQSPMYWFHEAGGDLDKLRAWASDPNPLLNPYRADIEAATHLSPGAQRAVQLGEQYYTEMGQQALDTGAIRNVRENYQNRIYQPEPPRDFVSSELATGVKQSTRHALQRVYDTAYDAVLGGKTFATTSYADALSIHNEEMARVNANRQMATAMQDQGLGRWMRPDNIPDGWAQVGKLEKNVPIKDAQGNAVIGDDGNQIVSRSIFAAPKGIADGLAAVADPDMLNRIDWIRGLGRFQGLVKTYNLSYSAFHHFQMGMSTLYQLWQSPSGMAGAVRDFPTLAKKLTSGAFQGVEQDFARYGGVTALSEANQDIMRQLRQGDDFVARITNAPVVSTLTKGAEASGEFLFGKVQRYLKVMDYENKITGWIANHPNATDDELVAAKRGYAREINAAYGGLNWEQMGVSKTALRAMRLFLLAPDWTLSNLALGKYAFQGGTAGTAARQHFAGAAAAGLLLTEGINYILTGHSSFDNPKGHELEVEVAPNVYISMFRGGIGDIIKLVSMTSESGLIGGPARFTQGKGSPIARTLVGLAGNVDYNGRPIMPRSEGGLANTLHGAQYVAGSLLPVPFGLSSAGNYLGSGNATPAGLGAVVSGIGRYSRGREPQRTYTLPSSAPPRPPAPPKAPAPPSPGRTRR